MAAGVTYTPIATTTLNSDTNNVTFSNIPGTYTDIVVVAFLKSNRSATASGIFVYPNGGVNYVTFTNLTGDGTSAGASRIPSANAFTGFYHEVTAASANDFTVAIYHFNNYSNTTTYKTVLYRTNLPSIAVKAYASRIPTTSAITSLQWSDQNGTGFISGSTFTLYGILAA